MLETLLMRELFGTLKRHASEHVSGSFKMLSMGWHRSVEGGGQKILHWNMSSK